ncbi:MAG: hypothetical protein Ta2E_02130 [Mycoplasmoidaceae bacterium]|nr:MAG: hypothetical protein Ta2E_02130 [Mycoplasmoidaceae bacterium]
MFNFFKSLIKNNKHAFYIENIVQKIFNKKYKLSLLKIINDKELYENIISPRLLIPYWISATSETGSMHGKERIEFLKKIKSEFSDDDSFKKIIDQVTANARKWIHVYENDKNIPNLYIDYCEYYLQIYELADLQYHE